MQTEPLQITSGRAAGVTKKPKRPPLRHWPVQDKRRIVEETFVPGASVSLVARKHDINSNMLFRWRREYQRGDFGPGLKPVKSSQGFVPLGVIGEDGRLVRGVGDLRRHVQAAADEGGSEDEPTPADAAAMVEPPIEAELASTVASPRAGTVADVPALGSRVEIELPGHVRFSFDASLDEAAIRRLIRLIKEVA
jgi:hypothetical protein